MRTTIAVFALLLSFQCVLQAQDKAPKVKEVDTNALLSSALEGNKDARTELLKLSVEDLQAVIVDFAFKATEKSGIIQMKTKCPDGYVRPYWVRIPKGYDPAKTYPAIVGLHGGVNSQSLYGKEEQPAPGRWSISFWEDNLGEQVDDIFLIGCSAGPRETDGNAIWWKYAGRQNIEHFIFKTKCQFNIDDDKVFVTGHSDGGSGCFALAAHNPNTFAGFFPMNGHPLVQAADGQGFWIENLKGKNIYAFNSGKDGLYPAKRITPIYDQANKAGADIKYSVHPDNNHGILSIIGKEIPKFMKEYFANWKRNLVPTSIDWTCEDTNSARCGWLEVTEIAELNGNVAEANKDITLGPSKVRLGILVKRDVEQPTVNIVVPKSTAEKMGIMVDDVIIELDGAKIAAMNDLLTALDKCTAGGKVTVKVKRAGKEKELEGEFAAADENAFSARVIATRYKNGAYGLTTRNTTKLSFHISPSMIGKEGNLKGEIIVTFEFLKGNERPVLSQKIEPDKEYILDCFLKTADRKSPFIAKVDIDLSKYVEPIKEESPPEDEF